MQSMDLETFKRWKQDKIKVRYIDELGHDEGVYLYPNQVLQDPDRPVMGMMKMQHREIWVYWDQDAHTYRYWRDVNGE
jgi:hypothetical protein